jgi:transposase
MYSKRKKYLLIKELFCILSLALIMQEDNMHNLTINNPNKIIKDIQDYFDKLPEGDFLHRLHAIFLIALGWNCPAVASYYKKSVRTIHSWVNTVNESGIEALRTANRSGRPSQLTDIDKEQLKLDLKLNPEIYGYHQVAWDGILLSRYLKERYGVALKPRRCQYLFHELGFSLKRPRKMPAKASQQQQQAFKKTFEDTK